MKRIIKLTESDLTRIVKRVMNEAVDSTPAISAQEAANRIKTDIANGKVYISDRQGNKHLVSTLLEDPRAIINNRIYMTVKDAIAFTGNEPISIYMPGCTITKPDSSFGIVKNEGAYGINSKYEISCTYNGASAPKMTATVKFINPTTRIDPA